MIFETVSTKWQVVSKTVGTNCHFIDILKVFLSASGTNQGAIDNRIEQAMDLVKSHLMNAVRSEVEELKEKIIKLEETISQQQDALDKQQTTISQQQDALDKQQTNFNREFGNLQRENEFLRSQVSTEVLLQYSNQQQQPQSQQQQPSSQHQ